MSLNTSFSQNASDLIMEDVLLHIAKYNSQRVRRLTGNTIEDVNNPNLELKFPDSQGYV